MIDAVFAEISCVISLRLVGIGNDMRIGIGKKPDLCEGLIAISEDRNLPALDRKNAGKVERRSLAAEKSCSLCIGHISRIAAQD